MKLRKFDTKVQHLKYKILREIAREAWNDSLLEKRAKFLSALFREKNLPCGAAFIRSGPSFGSA